MIYVLMATIVVCQLNSAQFARLTFRFIVPVEEELFRVKATDAILRNHIAFTQIIVNVLTSLESVFLYSGTARLTKTARPIISATWANNLRGANRDFSRVFVVTLAKISVFQDYHARRPSLNLRLGLDAGHDR